MKVVKYLIIIIVIVAVSFFIINNVNKNQTIETSNIDYIPKGMKVTLLGGSNQKDKGNIRSMGYIVRTRTDEVIFIDSGLDIDYDALKSYVDLYTNGNIDHWVITHGHDDHVGAYLEVLNKDDITIENLYYNMLSEEWYKENDPRGYESEKAFLDSLSNPKILNHIVCKAGDKFKIDNIEMDIIRVANPEITKGDNGNEASLVFKLTATDINKSMIFLADAMTLASPEILEAKDMLKSDAVQLAHHGNWGVTEEVYKAINPEVAFVNATENLYNNDNGQGYNSGNWTSIKVREWLENIGCTTFYKAFEGDQVFEFTEEGIIKIEE